jgi:hypothetical protein
MIKNHINFRDGPNAIHVYDQSQEITTDKAFSSQAINTQEDYMNAKISQGAIFHKVDASGTSCEVSDREIKTGGYVLKNNIMDDSLLAA